MHDILQLEMAGLCSGHGFGCNDTLSMLEHMTVCGVALQDIYIFPLPIHPKVRNIPLHSASISRHSCCQSTCYRLNTLLE